MSRIKYKLVILSRTFAKSTKEPLVFLESAGVDYELKRNNDPENEERNASLIGDADAIIVGSDKIGEIVFERCKNLKVISKHGVGLDAIDIKKAAEKNIEVTITDFANNESVADLTWLLMLAASRNFINKVMKPENVMQRWNSTQLGNETCDKIIGLVGYGKIGRAVALRARGFRNKLLVFDPFVKNITEEGLDIVKAEFSELVARSDIISLHAPLNDGTKNIINREVIGNMKDGVIIINTSRAGLIDENALLEALKSGKVKSAGIDVFSEEPPTGNALLALDNVIATPHIGAHSLEANYRMGMMAAENVAKALNKIQKIQEA
jgi:D-3-phosphoglycerate dehydrogenase